MNYSAYKIFVSDTLELARTMMIKFDWLGPAMERKLSDFGLPPTENKRQWRYYLHLAGQYHPLDVPMEIVSLDTNETITYTIENLKRHKKTRSVYLYNRSYTDVLKEKYPEQTILIRSILHPIDIDEAISAADGAVLWHDVGRVEPQEHNLIQELEKGIRSILFRTRMDSLNTTDDLFCTDILSKIFAFIPSKILLIRRKYVRTEQTHSFHIMAFLASNQRLDEFVPYMTLKQILFLYKNILYIERNTGKKSVFDMLVNNLFTARNLPLYSYSLRQKDMNVAEGEIVPLPVVVKEPLNLKTGISSRDLDQWEVVDLLYKERPLARDNVKYLPELIEEAEKKISYSSISNLPTKALEVSAVDPDDISPVKLIEVVLSEWLHMSTTNTYDTRLEIVNPLNGDIIKLTPGEMFLLFFYSQAAGFHDVHLKEIPDFIATEVMYKGWISDGEYLKFLEHDHFGRWEDELDFFAKTHYEIYNSINTPEEFLYTCQEILKRRRVRHQYIYNDMRHTVQIGRKKMYMKNYPDYICNLRQEFIKDFDDFFIFVALDREQMSAEGWQDLSMQALDIATKFTSHAKISLSEIQQAMVRLFKRLSSYSIQFIEEIVGGEREIVQPILAIPGDSMEFGIMQSETVGFESTITDVKISSKDQCLVDLPISTASDYTLRIERRADVDLWVDAKANGGCRMYADVNFACMSASGFSIRELT